MPIRSGFLVMILVAAGMVSTCLPASDSPQTPPQARVRPAEMRVDINRATIEELIKVPGMTRTWAGRIVRFRPYRTKQDLLDQGIVNGAVYNRIKDSIIAHRERQ